MPSGIQASLNRTREMIRPSEEPESHFGSGRKRTEHRRFLPEHVAGAARHPASRRLGAHPPASSVLLNRAPVHATRWLLRAFLLLVLKASG